MAHARHVAEATRERSPDEASWVDAEVAEGADGRLAWARFEAVVEGKVAAAAPELARAREEAAARDRCARMSRVNKHGMSTFTIRADAVSLAGIDAAVTALAATLAESRPDLGANDRRVEAVALLCSPDAHIDPDVGPVKPKVQLYLHLHPDSPVARLEGHGPVTLDWVRHTLVQRLGTSRFRITPVLDLAGQAPVDGYEIPARLREAVHLIHPADVFPFAAGTGRRMDLDHAQPYSAGGPTAVGNLGPLTRTHHRTKTHDRDNGRGWEVRHPFPGIVVWRDPYGAFYLVDPTGTRRIVPLPGDQAPSRPELAVSRMVVNYVAA